MRPYYGLEEHVGDELHRRLAARHIRSSAGQVGGKLLDDALGGVTVAVGVRIGLPGLGRARPRGRLHQRLTGLDQPVPPQLHRLHPLGLRTHRGARHPQEERLLLQTTGVGDDPAGMKRRGDEVGIGQRRVDQQRPPALQGQAVLGALGHQARVGQDDDGMVHPGQGVQDGLQASGVVGVLSPVNGGQGVGTLNQRELLHDRAGGAQDPVAHLEEHIGHDITDDDGAARQPLGGQVLCPHRGGRQE